jgi:hypothetical protein
VLKILLMTAQTVFKGGLIGRRISREGPVFGRERRAGSRAFNGENALIYAYQHCPEPRQEFPAWRDALLRRRQFQRVCQAQ